MAGVQERLGSRLVSLLNYIGEISVLFFRILFLLPQTALFWVPGRPYERKRQIYDQMVKIGIDSLPIALLIALFIGIVLALQSAYQMAKLSLEIYIPPLVTLSMVREIGPILTALIVAGRVGAAITAELGTMKVTEQIDALETLAVNPVSYLVVPRFLALSLMLPLLTVYADITGIFGGYLVGVGKLGIRSGMYIQMTWDPLVLKDVFSGLLKAFVFGMIIAVVGCFEGMRARGGAEGVGEATRLSVVNSFILIIAANCFFTALFYFVKF